MRERHRLVGWAFLVALIATPALAEEPPGVPVLSRPLFGTLERLRVTRIVDGDTVHVRRGGSDVSVRMIGVDAPETVDPRKPVQEYGREAALFLTNLLKGEDVWLEYDPAQRLDKYGRTLAYLHRAPDGLNVNAEIIRQGYGVAYTLFPHPYLEQFRALERRARLLEKGLHGPPRSPETAPPPATGPPATPPTPPGTPPAMGEPTAPTPPGQEATVYVTRTGAKYHRATCSYLRSSSIPMSLSEARARYSPCSRCNPPP